MKAQPTYIANMYKWLRSHLITYMGKLPLQCIYFLWI